jgi:hydroxypyruvate isomerase
MSGKARQGVAGSGEADSIAMIGEVQVADNPGRCEPGTGEMNDAGVAQALTRMMYSGPVGLESFAQGNEKSALTAFRNAFTV